ncbi:hypothetical protein KGQ19_26725 [Catenulispora sp. NL8]|uniref:Uncharacterized protein n=1 Tax=Catenulispora pinistramenti TaxID=2705254 RepID=A0ABS5KWY4_9ACTN|nr:hypothetical protein [Catenulispora pinistramenti]MBS2550470.1 hypothetical protein [Catenulispora pinistramenti]
MKDDSSTVVFVNASDLAALTNRSKQRISQLIVQPDDASAGAILPVTRVLINGNPAWPLDSVIPALVRAKYSVSESVVKRLRDQRAVPDGTIPVGVTEAAEVLTTSPDTLRKRSKRGATAPESFRFGTEIVWDLDTLVDDARIRGFAINEEAEAKWREANRPTPLVRREVEVVARIKLSVPAADDDSRVKAAGALVRSILLPTAASNPDRVRVLDVEVQTVSEASTPAP